MIFESPQRKQAFAALGVLIIAFAVQLSWMFIRSQMALEQQPESSQGISSDLDVMEIAMQMFNFIPGTITSNANISGTDLFAYRMPAIVFIPLSWLCIIGVIGAFSIKQLSIKMKSITLSTILAGVFFAPLLAISLSLILGSYYQIPPRYGASILLSFLISAGLLIQNKPASIFLLIYTVSLNILTIALAPLLAP